VVCRQLGKFGAGHAYHKYFKAPVVGPMHLTNMSCEGDEGGITDCPLVRLTEATTPDHCTLSQAIGIDCGCDTVPSGRAG